MFYKQTNKLMEFCTSDIIFSKIIAKILEGMTFLTNKVRWRFIWKYAPVFCAHVCLLCSSKKIALCMHDSSSQHKSTNKWLLLLKLVQHKLSTRHKQSLYIWNSKVHWCLFLYNCVNVIWTRKMNASSSILCKRLVVKHLCTTKRLRYVFALKTDQEEIVQHSGAEVRGGKVVSAGDEVGHQAVQVRVFVRPVVLAVDEGRQDNTHCCSVALACCLNTKTDREVSHCHSS